MFGDAARERWRECLRSQICGNSKEGEPCYFRYRSSSYLTEFFEICDTDYRHGGSTRNHWVADTLKSILAEPHPDATPPPPTFARVIRALMDQSDAEGEAPERPQALATLNTALAREGFEAFWSSSDRGSPLDLQRLAGVKLTENEKLLDGRRVHEMLRGGCEISLGFVSNGKGQSGYETPKLTQIRVPNRQTPQRWRSDY